MRRLTALPILATLLVAAACAEPAGQRVSGPVEMGLFATKPISCPTNTTATASATIDAAGGEVGVAGTAIIVPAGALAGPTELTVTVPAGNTMSVRIKATGADYFRFLDPVTVVVDYSRCARSSIDRTPLSVWYVDDATGQFREQMLVLLDDKLTRRIAFVTGHLSSYVVAE